MNFKSQKIIEDYKFGPILLIHSSSISIMLEIVGEKVHLIHQSAKNFLLKNRQLNSAKFCKDLDPTIYLGKVLYI